MKKPWLLQKGIFRFIVLNLVIAIAYAIGVNLSFKLAGTLAGSVTPVWLPSGMTLALVYWLGDRVFFGIACGSFLALSPSLLQRSPSLSVFYLILINVACACGNIVQPLIATYLIKRFGNKKNIFSHVNSVVVYISAAIFSPSISATLGISSLWISGVISSNNYVDKWLIWWITSALAHLIFTPTFLLWKSVSWKEIEYNFRGIGLFLLLFVLVCWVAFGQSYSLAYLLLPILIWTVFRYGSFVSSLLVNVVFFLAVFTTTQGYGLYVKNSPDESMLHLQSFIAIFSLTSLILSAVIDERKEAQLTLQKTLENLENLVIERTAKLEQSEDQINGFFSSAPIGLGILDRDLKYVRVNQVLANMNGKLVEEHLSRTLREVVPDISPQLERFYEQVLRTGEPILNQEISSKELNETGEEQTWLTSFFPIFDNHHVPSCVGFVVVEISNQKKSEASLVLARAILREANAELEKLVNVDGLTQIANRRCFDDRLAFEWERLAREQLPLSLLLFDIDYFKRFNDCYGHQVGDDCLTKIANSAQQTVCRPADLVARYGGEEFVVILPNTDLNGAIAVANQLQSAIMDLNIPHQNSDISDIVTISLGVTSLIPDFNQLPSILIKQADTALYSAKKQGRDRSVVFPA